MSLATNLFGLSAWFNSVANGEAEFTAEGMAAFGLALEKTAERAAAIEDGQPDPVHDDAFTGLLQELGVSVRPVARPPLALAVDNTGNGGAS